MEQMVSSTQEQHTISAAELKYFKKLQEKEAKAKAYAKRSTAKQAILAKIARDMGAIVSEADIDAYLAKEQVA
jgi:hypothetical protein